MYFSSISSKVPRSIRLSVANHAMAAFREFDGAGSFTFHDRLSVELVPPEREGDAWRRSDRLAEADFSCTSISSGDEEYES